jgi:hypothetical protein
VKANHVRLHVDNATNVAINHVTNMIYVSQYCDGTIRVIDRMTDRVVDIIKGTPPRHTLRPAQLNPKARARNNPKRDGSVRAPFRGRRCQ